MVELVALLNVTLSGLFVGSVYSLISMGLTLIWGTLRVVNFAHGALMAFAMYAAFWCWSILGLDPLVSIFLIFPLMFAIGVAIEGSLIAPILKADVMAQLLLTFGLMLVITNAMAYFWSTNERLIIPWYAYRLFEYSGVLIDAPRAITFVASVSFAAGLYVFMTRTSWGWAIRATALDREAAEASGINVATMFAIVFGLGTAMAGLAGVLVSTYYPVTPDAGSSFLYLAFVAVILGSLGNYIGALVGGLLLGVVEALTAFLWLAQLSQAVAFALFIIILVFRPQGLFAKSLRS